MTTPPQGGRRRGPGPNRVIITDPPRLPDRCDTAWALAEATVRLDAAAHLLASALTDGELVTLDLAAAGAVTLIGRAQLFLRGAA